MLSEESVGTDLRQQNGLRLLLLLLLRATAALVKL